MKKWQHICGHNSGKPGWILIYFAYLETGMNALCKQATYFFYFTCDVIMTSLLPVLKRK